MNRINVKKNCSLSTTYNGEMTHRKQQKKTMNGDITSAALHTSALALCYSVAEYCCPVWFRSAHTDLVDAQQLLNSSMRLISGTLRPTQLPWLPVLTNILHPTYGERLLVTNCCRLPILAVCSKLLQTVEMHPDWPVHQDFFNHPPPRPKSRKPIWSDNAPVDVVSKWKEDWQSNSVTNKNLISDPTIRLPGFNLQRPTWSLVNAKPFPNWTGPLCCQSTQMAHGPYG